MVNNPYSNAQGSYSNAQQLDLDHADPGEVEGYALIELASRIEAAKNSGDKDEIRTVNRLNWKIWTILQTSLISEESGLPKHIRENMLSLSNFVDRRSAELLTKPVPEKLDILIHINKNIGAGLLEGRRRAKKQEKVGAAQDAGSNVSQGGVVAAAPADRKLSF